MASATISSKYQVVIPKGIRQEIPIRVGDVVRIIAKGGVITMVPDRPLSGLRGLMKGAKLSGIREKKDRL